VWRRVLATPSATTSTDLLERLHHVHLVQKAFLCLWRGEEIDPQAGEGLDAEALAEWAQGLHREIRDFLADLDASRLDAPLDIPWSVEVERRLGFAPAPTSIGDSLIQVFAHTAHHRGQICLRLRELGGEPPLVDYIAWIWRGRPAPGWP